MPVQTGQGLDLETSREFMRQIMTVITTGELTNMARELEQKSLRFGADLAPESVRSLGPDGWQRLMRRCLATKRHHSELLALTGPEELGPPVADLLYGEGDPAQRLEHFCRRLGDKGEAWTQVATDFGSECLYMVHPQTNWPWTRYMWEPRTGAGSLRLVVLESFDLRGRGIADTYRRVGEAVQWVRELGTGEGMWPPAAGQFGADVFLACVYVVYMYTVLRMRMTREFNQVIPQLPEMTRRLLGTHRMGAEGTSHG